MAVSASLASGGLTATRLRELLDYDAVTGVFTWLVTLSNRGRAGTRAGNERKDGYRRIRVNGEIFLEHRLAWLYVYGEWPLGNLDHKDTITSHNWISNLRIATIAENGRNRYKQRNNTSGFKGVSRSGDKWIAMIGYGGKQKNLGKFSTPEAAHDAYCVAAKDFHGEFARAF